MKHNKNFNLVLVGQIISLFGSAIQRFSISLYLLELTGSAVVYSNILALSAVPYIVAAPVAGAIADSFDRKKIMIVLDVMAGCVLLGYAGSFRLGMESALLAGVVLILLSVIAVCYNPAVTACLPQIVAKEDMNFANSCISQVSAWSNILGPVFAGMIYSVVGIQAIVAFNAVSFLFSAVLECYIHMPPQEKQGKTKLQLSGSFGRMADTAKILRRDYKTVLGIIIHYGLFNICIVPINSIIFPAVMNLELQVSSQVYGMVEGICTCGMLLSGILIALKGNRIRFAQMHRWYAPMVLSLLTMGMTLFLSPYKSLAVAAMAVGGFVNMFCIGIGNILSLTYTQQSVPVEMLGSVSALSTAFATATVPLGQVLFGQLQGSGMTSGFILMLSALGTALVILYIKDIIRKGNRNA